MSIRRYKVDVSCATCQVNLDKVFKQYPAIKYSVNLMEQILKVDCDPKEFSDQKIHEIVKQAGYVAKRM